MLYYLFYLSIRVSLEYTAYVNVDTVVRCDKEFLNKTPQL